MILTIIVIKAGEYSTRDNAGVNNDVSPGAEHDPLYPSEPQFFSGVSDFPGKAA